MNKTEIKNFTTKTNRFIEKNELKNALDSIKALADKLQNWTITDKLNELKNNYKYMLHYLIEGSKDPEQDKIYHKLLRDTYKLTSDAAEAALTQESSQLFFEKIRIANMRAPLSMNEYGEQIKKNVDTKALLSLFEEGDEKTNRTKKNAQEHERTVSDMFYTIFSSPRANDDIIKEYTEFMIDEIIPVDDKSMFISALMLNILQRFDLKKIVFLLECCSHTNMEISIRSIVALTPILQLYKKRWHLYPEFINRISLLSDDGVFRRRLLISIIQFIQSRETEKITKKLTEEILPEMMKLSPIIGKKIRMDEWMGETGMEDKNPEWQKILDDAGITDKLEEFSNLQMQGADVFHSTFSNLKSYPFFNEMSNWFLPFNLEHSQLHNFITENTENKGVIKSITNATFICNSDKYSFCYSIMMMPEQYRKMMSSQLGAESEELKNMRDEEFTINPYQEEEAICKQYVQDLYRFYKVYPRKDDFMDIFSMPLNYHKIDAISSIVSVPENLEKIALYYFEKNHLPEALSAYEILSELDPSNSEVWQKIGYCKQQLVDLEGAVEAYLRADLIELNNTWVLRRIAQCYRLLKQPEKALQYYRKLEKLHPEDLNVQLNIGHCFLELKEYEEALKNYFKVEWLDDTNRRVWRSIAWCSFLSHKFDVSQKYYAKILENEPNSHDYMNAGHVELCLKNMKKAMNYYSESIKKMKNMKSFKSLLKEDFNELRLAGVDLNILPALLDKIAYDLE
ncbi:MAG: tetratricopeptide repeat protein [Dysgonamonadaceae bacterium]